MRIRSISGRVFGDTRMGEWPIWNRSRSQCHWMMRAVKLAVLKTNTPLPMKSCLFNRAKRRIGTLAAFGFLSTSTLVNAGIIDLLRGDVNDQPPQRVAFVGAAQVKEVEGEVERLAGVERWTAVQTGDQLEPGDLLRTGSGSVVLCMRESESFVKVTGNTLCRLVPIEKGWDRAVVSGQEEKEGFVVRSCRGKAYAGKGDGSWAPLTVNTVLAQGTEVRTAPGALVDLFHTGYQRPVRLIGSVEITLNEQVLARRVSTPQSLAARQ